MEPEDVIWTDRSIFDSELEDLIGSAVDSDTTTSSQRHSAVHENPSKRQKTNQYGEEGGLSNDDNLHMHPTRKLFLEHPDTLDVQPTAFLDEDQNHILTGGNLEPLSGFKNVDMIPIGPRSGNRTSNLIRRQWDPTKDTMDYEVLLEQRRSEKVQNVDRYVPNYQAKNMHLAKFSATASRSSKGFPLDKLPDNVKKKIFSLLLVAPDSIVIDFYWLRPFVNGHARIPSVSQSIQHDGATYTIPVSWSRLLPEIDLMRSDMLQFSKALETRGTKTKHTRSPCRGLTTGLLRVSRGFSKIAAPVFYGQNVFKFPCATSAWMQLDSFLTTIGPANARSIQRLSIHVPLWHRGIKEDFVEGSLIDLLSPASRMAVVKPPPHDRLLSAVQHTVQILLQSELRALSFDVENGLDGDYWCGRLTTDRKLISVAEAEEFVERKQEGMALLKQVSDMLAATNQRPLLKLFQPFRSATHDKKEFRNRFTRVQVEAKKYGWRVDTHLRHSR